MADSKTRRVFNLKGPDDAITKRNVTSVSDIKIDTKEPPKEWNIPSSSKKDSKKEAEEDAPRPQSKGRGRPKGRKNDKTIRRENSKENVIPPPTKEEMSSLSRDFASDPLFAADPAPSSISAGTQQQQDPPVNTVPQPSVQPTKESREERLKRIHWILKAQTDLGVRLKTPLTKEELTALSDRDFDEYAAMVLGAITRLQGSGNFLVNIYFSILSSLEGVNEIPDLYEKETGTECPGILKLLRHVKLTGPKVNVIEEMKNNDLYIKTLQEVIEGEDLMQWLLELSPPVRLLLLTGFIMGNGIFANIKAEKLQE